jgi:trehalose/maltose hydrolase-like predicted phosphorylase
LVNILTGKQEHHISADVAYAVWQYWRATGDDAFMLAAGAEILIETARFWASRAQIEHDGRAHIRQVIGPDEYHETVDDSAYTNTMVTFNLECAADAAAILEREQTSEWQRLSARLGLMEQEAHSWRALAAALITGFDPATKLIEQFAGYSSSKRSTSLANGAAPRRLIRASGQSVCAARRQSSKQMWSHSARYYGKNGPSKCMRRTSAIMSLAPRTAAH